MLYSSSTRTTKNRINYPVMFHETLTNIEIKGIEFRCSLFHFFKIIMIENWFLNFLSADISDFLKLLSNFCRFIIFRVCSIVHYNLSVYITEQNSESLQVEFLRECFDTLLWTKESAFEILFVFKSFAW